MCSALTSSFLSLPSFPQVDFLNNPSSLPFLYSTTTTCYAKGGGGGRERGRGGGQGGEREKEEDDWGGGTSLLSVPFLTLLLILILILLLLLLLLHYCCYCCCCYCFLPSPLYACVYDLSGRARLGREGRKRRREGGRGETGDGIQTGNGLVISHLTMAP